MYFKQQIVFLIALLSSITLFAQGYQIPEKPALQTSVYDYINLFSVGQKNALENKLIRYSDSTSTQIVVALIDSTEGEDIGYLATNWADKWGFGQAKEDNGVFILVAKGDRKVTIRSGYGVEHLLTDYTSRQIIEYVILPSFKQGDFYGGLNNGADAVFEVLNGEFKGSPRKSDGLDGGTVLFIVMLIIFLFLLSKGNKNNSGRGGGYRRSPSILDTIILSNSGRGGFGGGSFGGGFGSSGGGFGGGFGGGGFGGGGATGGW